MTDSDLFAVVTVWAPGEAAADAQAQATAEAQDRAAAGARDEVTAGARDVENAEELLVEEISIDGMCGVY